MLVSWEWLSDYVDIAIGHEEMATRWALTGLNHESTEMVDGVPVIDLEITSNRGDCLGHIGIAREASVLLNTKLRYPAPQLKPCSESVSAFLSIENQFEAACPRYIGRLIRGVKIGPSPDWLKKRLESIGVKSINNVVDATNYVMFECGQPLHAFDFGKIHGGKIIIRPARDKEMFLAIDHRTYQLDSQMVVIADEDRAVALGGVMGGVDSEVGFGTVDLLVEAAEFIPLAIRRTARKLKLHSPSSYRFERRVDPAQLDWASQRCCELILAMAGGSLLSGSVDTGARTLTNPSILLRENKVASVLGIQVPWDRSLDILVRLGCEVKPLKVDGEAHVDAPSYRSDLTREIDLIEEIARIHGYDQIPEDAPVPLVSSAKRPRDMMMQTVRMVTCAAGFDETLTPSLISKSQASTISPWSNLDPMSTLVPLLEGANQLRRSLVPSLIASRLYNQSQSNRDTWLFETAGVYLAAASGSMAGHVPAADAPAVRVPALQVPTEQCNLGVIGPTELRTLAGLFEEILDRVCGPDFLLTHISKHPVAWDFLAANSGMSWMVDGQMLAWFGKLSRSIVDGMKLDASNTVGELNLDLLQKYARLVPQLQPVIPFPTIERDLNLIVDESLQWQLLSNSIQKAAGLLCINVVFVEIYRDPAKDGQGKKRILLSLHLRSSSQTLTGEQADEVVQNVLNACKEQFQAELLPVK